MHGERQDEKGKTPETDGLYMSSENLDPKQMNFASDYPFWYGGNFDNKLTEKGIQQSKDTGNFLQKYFKLNNLNFDKIIIEFSPFIGCMMTAGQIARELGVKQTTINHKAHEILLENYVTNPAEEYLQMQKFEFDLEKMKEEIDELKDEKMFPWKDVKIESFTKEQIADFRENSMKLFPEEIKQGLERGIKLF